MVLRSHHLLRFVHQAYCQCYNCRAQSFEPLRQSCQMTLLGVCTVTNIFPVPLQIVNVGFLLSLHDDVGEEPLLPPIVDNPILVGSAVFVPIHTDSAETSNESGRGTVKQRQLSDGGMVEPGQSLPAHMWLHSSDYETCVRVMSTMARKDVMVDLEEGFVTLRFREQDYNIEWTAHDVQLPV